MTRTLITFVGTFLLGALIALIARAALYQPHADQPAASGTADYAPLVHNPLAPAAAGAGSAPAAAPAAPDPHAAHRAVAAGPHEGHETTPAKPKAEAGQPVNTVCAICGMEVDPKLPTATYQGKTIGFGCRMCPPKFKADPDRYGPYYLRNEVIER